MNLKIILWNVRGVNDKEKWKIIKAFLKPHKAGMVCLQEIKSKAEIVKQSGNGEIFGVAVVNAMAAPGGMVVFGIREWCS